MAWLACVLTSFCLLAHCSYCLSLCPTAKLVIVSSNCPPVRKSEIEYYAMLSKTGVHHYSGSELQRNSSAVHSSTRLSCAVVAGAAADRSRQHQVIWTRLAACCSIRLMEADVYCAAAATPAAAGMLKQPARCRPGSLLAQ